MLKARTSILCMLAAIALGLAGMCSALATPVQATAVSQIALTPRVQNVQYYYRPYRYYHPYYRPYYRPYYGYYRPHYYRPYYRPYYYRPYPYYQRPYYDGYVIPW
jgi:hypothetical protein